MTDWTRFARGVSLDKADTAKDFGDFAVTSVGSPYWINSEIKSCRALVKQRCDGAFCALYSRS